VKPLPRKAIEALDGLSWFTCRHCHGVFVLGTRAAVATTDEAKQARRHEAWCADGPAQPAPVRVRLMFTMTDGTDYELTLSPSVPAGADFLQFIELQGPGGVPVGRWPLHDHGRGLHTICHPDSDGIEAIEA
jgi:hypothetical protein